MDTRNQRGLSGRCDAACRRGSFQSPVEGHTSPAVLRTSASLGEVVIELSDIALAMHGQAHPTTKDH